MLEIITRKYKRDDLPFMLSLLTCRQACADVKASTGLLKASPAAQMWKKWCRCSANSRSPPKKQHTLSSKPRSASHCTVFLSTLSPTTQASLAAHLHSPSTPQPPCTYIAHHSIHPQFPSTLLPLLATVACLSRPVRPLPSPLLGHYDRCLSLCLLFLFFTYSFRFTVDRLRAVRHTSQYGGVYSLLISSLSHPTP